MYNPMDELKKKHKASRLIRWIQVFFVILWSGGCCLHETAPLVKGLDLKGFQQAGPMVVYNRNNLFDYMNGEAEVYLPLGFQVLYSQGYRKQESDGRIIVDIYDMATPKGAQSVFAEYTQNGGAVIQAAGVSAWTDQYFVLFWRNNYFFRVWPDPAPMSEEKPQLQDMIDLSRVVDEALF